MRYSTYGTGVNQSMPGAEVIKNSVLAGHTSRTPQKNTGHSKGVCVVSQKNGTKVATKKRLKG